METYDALLIDAGTGNLHSVHNALLQLGFQVRVSCNPEDLNRPGRVVLPGVGAFGSFMQGLRERKLVEPLQNAVRRGDAMLGICVGMQALFELSEEMGENAGLGLLTGKVVHFPQFTDRKVPHTGWNQLWFTEGNPLFRGLQPGAYAYFNHSFYCAASNLTDIAAKTDYGIDFCSAAQHQNLFGVQFHPEKSQRVGQHVLENFFKA
ncbi:MAG: imidazole glycerol phosphate synthase subunit HisH [Anaerolineaceae bacterium]|nr:imidazole glycerol phosphate synthase subunit HisH [Anaerolineaceae bacterium]